MGRLQAMEMAGMLDLQQGLSWHLRYNCYPSVDQRWLPLCIDVVREAADLIICDASREEWMEWGDTEVHNGKTKRMIMEGLHLEDFAEAEAARLQKDAH